MITQSKKLLKLYLENNPIRITTPLLQNPTWSEMFMDFGKTIVDLVKTPEALFSKVLAT